MNLGKCDKCAKSVYDLEGYTVGPPGKTVVFHKMCFKCSNPTCTWTLNMTNYKFWDGKAYCKNHYPVTGFGDQSAVHASGTSKTDDANVKAQVNAPKATVVNDQVRGQVCPSCNAPRSAAGSYCAGCGNKYPVH